MKRIPVIIDTDPGIDDVLALMLALRSPELSVEAVTVVAGNTPLEICGRNAAGVVALDSTNVPVVCGCSHPLRRQPVAAGHVHGDDGAGGAAELLPRGRIADGFGPDVILEIAARHPGEVTLITLGPLTNAATALLRDAGRFRLLKGLIVMGGAFRVPGNVTAGAEFNIYADPDAAALVLASGVPVTVVGLDVTTRVLLPRARFLEALGDRSPFLRKAVLHYMDFCAGNGLDGCHLHDPLAVAAAIDPTLLQAKPVYVEVETEGRTTLGMTVGDFRPWSDAAANARVCLEVDADRFLTLFVDRVLRL